MSKTIDERVVEMRFDNKQFESNVQTSLSTIEKLKKSLDMDGATKGLESIDSAAKKVDMSGLGSAVETVMTRFSALEIMAVSNTSISGLMFLSSMTLAMYSTSFGSFVLTLDGKLDEPVARLADSGFNASASQRASPDFPPRAPVEICLMIGQPASLSNFTVSPKTLISVVGNSFSSLA